MPLFICFLNHNILLINAREDDKLDTGQTVLVKSSIFFTFVLCAWLWDAREVFDIKGKKDKLLLASLNDFFISSCFNLQCLKQVFLPAVRFSRSKDECECCFLQLPIQHSAISPASRFHFNFSSSCFGCTMRGQSVSSVGSILGRRWRLPGSSYSTDHQRSPCWLDALVFIPLQTNKQEIPLQMPLSKHPRVLTRTGTLILSVCILALSICVFTASSRQRKSKRLDLSKPSLPQVFLAGLAEGLGPQPRVLAFPRGSKMHYSLCSLGNLMGRWGWKLQHQKTCQGKTCPSTVSRLEGVREFERLSASSVSILAQAPDWISLCLHNQNIYLREQEKDWGHTLKFMYLPRSRKLLLSFWWFNLHGTCP